MATCSSTSASINNDKNVIEKYLPTDDDEISETSEENSLVKPLQLTKANEESPDENLTSCWRQRKEENYEREKRKRRRNLGQEYLTSKTKKTVKARELGPPCSCKRKCREQLTNTYETIFKNFWSLGDYDLQNRYLFECIHVDKKKRSYKKKQKRQESSRNFTAHYTVNVDGQDVKVCKAEFMSLHGLQNSRGRIDHIVNMKTSGAVTPAKDGRGRHENRHNKLPYIPPIYYVDVEVIE